MIKIGIKYDLDIDFDPDKELMDRIGIYMVSSTQEKIMHATPPNSPLTVLNKGGDNPLRDTGQLFNSITHFPEKNKVTIGTDKPYAPVHQFGATIRPKKAKKLAIPFGWRVRRDVEKYGSVEKTIEAYKKQGWKIRFTPAKILGKENKKSPWTVLFVRTNEVRIPKREFLYIDKKDEETIFEIILDYFNSH